MCDSKLDNNVRVFTKNIIGLDADVKYNKLTKLLIVKRKIEQRLK